MRPASCFSIIQLSNSREIQTAVELEPEDAFYHDKLGDVLEQMGRHEEAQKEKQTAAELEIIQNGRQVSN